LQDVGEDTRIILKCILRKYDGGVECVGLAQGREKWRAVESTEKKIQVS
jgi:hypothetical protein